MPIYEYTCTKCKQEVEILQKISERPLKKCPQCGGRLSKRVSQSAFHLKGAGWYKDGYSTPPPKPKEKGKEKKAEAKEKEKKPEKKDKSKE